jgi:prepilin-type N-terminal cleavage/methylation domain-containing protein
LEEDKMKKGFTLIELLVVILILSILISIAAVSFSSALGRATETACKKILGDLYKACYDYCIGGQSFPFAGDNAEAYQHWQVLYDNEKGTSVSLMKCPAMARVKVPDVDPDTGKVTLRPETCSYAYSKDQVSHDSGRHLLAADKDYKRGGTGDGHQDVIVVLRCDGSIDAVKVKEGENWETVTKGELTK